MPEKTIRVPPKLFMKYKGVNIYHAYAEDDINWPCDYHYTTDLKERPEYEFEIEGELKDVRKTIREYIEQGKLLLPADRNK